MTNLSKAQLIERIGHTKAYQTAKDHIPFDVWNAVLNYSARFRIDLNSIAILKQDNEYSYIFGYPKTRFMVRVTKEGVRICNKMDYYILKDLIVETNY